MPASIPHYNSSFDLESKHTAEVAPRPDFRLERAADRLHSLPPRIIFELLTELGRVHDITGDVVARAEKFAAVDPDLLRALGGDRFPPRIRAVA